MDRKAIICKGKQEDFINYGSWMASLTDSQALHPPNSDEEIEEIQETDLEDPARSWIDLVEAYKSADPGAVRTMMNDAKRSRWTHAKMDEFEGMWDLHDLKKMNDKLESKEELDEGPPPSVGDLDWTLNARTKVTARQQVYCPFCGNWFTALDFVKHTC